jgi:hypothetical protein
VHNFLLRTWVTQDALCILISQILLKFWKIEFQIVKPFILK